MKKKVKKVKLPKNWGKLSPDTIAYLRGLEDGIKIQKSVQEVLKKERSRKPKKV
jgi:hypothetical protein